MKRIRTRGHDIVKNINVKRYFLSVYKSIPCIQSYRHQLRASTDTKAGFSSLLAEWPFVPLPTFLIMLEQLQLYSDRM